MKKFVIMLLLAMLVVPSVKAADKKDDLEIAVVFLNITIPFAGFIKEGVDQAAADYGVNAYMTGATDWQTGSQIQILENLITKGVDGLSTAVLDAPALTPLIAQSMEAGIPTTTFNVDAPDSKRLGYCGCDYVEAGRAFATALVDSMGEKGKILITTVAAGARWSKLREQGVREILKNYPEIEVIDLINADGDEQTAYAALENSYLANQDMNGMISLGGTQYLWARMLENRGVGNMNSDHPIYNTGPDLYEEKLLQIQDGWATAAFGQSPYKQGYQAVKMLVEYIRNGVKPTVIDTGVYKVDKENVQKFLDDLVAGKPVG